MDRATPRLRWERSEVGGSGRGCTGEGSSATTELVLLFGVSKRSRFRLERDRVPSLFGAWEAVVPTSFEAQDLPGPFRPRRPLGFRSSDAERSRPAVVAGLRGSQKSHSVSLAHPSVPGGCLLERSHLRPHPPAPPASLSRNHFLRPVAELPLRHSRSLAQRLFNFFRPLELLLGLI